MVQWLGLSAYTAEAQVRSLFRELRSHKPCSVARKKKKKKKEVEHLHLFTYSLFQCISFCVPTKRIHRLYVVLSNLTITQITDVKKSLQRNHNLNVIIMMPKKEPMAQLLEIWIEEPLFLIINLASNIQ